MTDDFYDLLDISTDASQEEIRAAFREQVRIYHPDLNDDDRAQAQFTALKKAYDVLGDPVERRAYDRLGHEEYVAKRTKGLPSPDKWIDRSDSEKEETSSSEDTSGVTTSSGPAWSRDGTTNANATGGTATRGATRSDGGSGFTSRSYSTGGRRGSATAGGRLSGLKRWWRSQNFALPLIWSAIVLYLVGLVHYALHNGEGYQALFSELTATSSVDGAFETLTSGAFGIETGYGFVSTAELVAVPVEPVQWYAALGGIVVVSVLALLAVRVGYREDTWGPVSLDETIVFALAVTAATVPIGGPLLAGALLLPLLFGVVIRHTRKLPGWSPSYVYVLFVAAPLTALAAGAVGYELLAIDLVAILLLPLVGAFGFVGRITLRTRYGI